MKDVPGWPRISSSLCYDQPLEAIDWLCRAFGFEVRIKIVGESGRLEHSELTFGDGVVMVGAQKPEIARWEYRKPPRALSGANTQNLFVYVDDVEAHCARARAAGAAIVRELETVDYGPDYWSDRGYEARDIGGHHWFFAQRLRTRAP